MSNFHPEQKTHYEGVSQADCQEIKEKQEPHNF